ncbi:MAG: sulfatase-like hydrolase/transferase, partial [bacterium]|nr:sulfatase-like hydrolase/transferase [bacterium]
MSTGDRPNVLLIISEDNGPHLGCYGDRFAKTPNLDRLASEGVRFANAFSTQAVCSPGRASILTGLYPHQCGQIGLATHKYALYDDFPNLHSLLKGAGYRTGLIGKLHINPESAFPFDMWWNERESISFAHRDVRKMAEMAEAFMAPSAEPFFLQISHPDAHLPFHRQQFGVPEEPVEGKDVEPLPFVGVDTPHIREQTADYYN